MVVLVAGVRLGLGGGGKMGTLRGGEGLRARVGHELTRACTGGQGGHDEGYPRSSALEII